MANEKRLKLIDYDEIRKLFDEEYKRTAQLIRDGETHLDNLAEGFTEADRVIFKLPTVDAVEVVHGEWGEIYTCHGERLWGYRCSQCEADNSKKSNYCPNCGAKMDLEVTK